MKKIFLLGILSVLAILMMSSSCKETKKNSGAQGGSSEVIASPFNAENAYRHIQAQVSFGPRVPNSKGHRACSAYIINELEQQALSITEQHMTLTAYDGTKLESLNIIGSYRPEANRRIMIFAHWDTRPMADHDPDTQKRGIPIDGADDGASGPGVMLELARLLNEEGLEHVGVDLIFFDAEDYGVPTGTPYDGNSEETWALGTQYWTRHLHREDYSPEFGILLDMVGAEHATFYREYFSQESAGKYVTRIWQTAKERGHEKYFINKMGGAITDDHYFIIKNRRIPCVNIINYDPNSSRGFGHYWHTHQDNIDNISKESLQAVGETVWQVLLDFDAGLF